MIQGIYTWNFFNQSYKIWSRREKKFSSEFYLVIKESFIFVSYRRCIDWPYKFVSIESDFLLEWTEEVGYVLNHIISEELSIVTDTTCVCQSYQNEVHKAIPTYLEVWRFHSVLFYKVQWYETLSHRVWTDSLSGLFRFFFYV